MSRYRQVQKIRERSDLLTRSAYSGLHLSLGLTTVSAFYKDIELATHKLYFSRHDRVVTDANHENMSVFIVLGGALPLEDFRFAILTLLALWLSEDAFCLLRPPPRNFLIFCGDRMSRVCSGLAAISLMIFPSVRIASRPRNLAPLNSKGRTFLHSPRRKLYHVRAVRMARRNRRGLFHALLHHPRLTYIILS